MKQLTKKVFALLTKAQQKKLLPFFLISFANSILDFISIALLTPFILLIIDRSKFEIVTKTYLPWEINQQHIFFALLCFIIFYILKNILQTTIIKKQTKYLYGIGSELSKKLTFHFLYGNYANFYNADKGKMIRDFLALPIIFITSVILPLYNFISEIIIVGVIVIVGLYLDPLVTLISTILVVLCALGLFYFRNGKTKKFNTVITNAHKQTLSHLINVLNGYLEIKSAGFEEDFIARFHETNTIRNTTLAEMSAFKQNNVRYLEILVILFIALLSGLILFNVVGNTNIVLLAFLGSAIIKIIPSFTKIVNAYLDIKSNIYSVDILSQYSFKEFLPQKKQLYFEGELRMENVHFNYPEKKVLLQDLNFSLKKGDFLAITGPSGVGKTTFLHLLCGILTPNSGKIYIDRKVVLQHSFIPFVSLVPQEPFIFHGTLLQNICMHDCPISDDDQAIIMQLLQKVELLDWFHTLPNGLGTHINEGGKTISGGQKQRIALIRALYAKPKILLLDEATSQLNQSLEENILEYLKEEVNKGSFIVAAVLHNVKSLQYANKEFAIHSPN